MLCLRFAVQQFVGEVEETEHGLAVVDARQQNHDRHVRHHQVQVVLGQLIIHSLQSLNANIHNGKTTEENFMSEYL